MAHKGWISIHRKIRENWVWDNNDPFDKRSAWIDILLMVNHKKKKFLFGNELMEVEAGERITSERKLAERWNWSRTKVRNFLELLEKDKMIEVKKTPQKRTRLKVLNYGYYQESENHKKTSKEPQENQRSTTEEPQKNLNNNDNNDLIMKNNDNKIPYKKIVSYLNQKADRSFKSTSQATQRHISGRWNEGFELEDFKNVIDKKCAEWLNDNEMSKYLRPRTLFGTKFEGYLNQPYPKEGNNDKNKVSKKDRGASEGSIGEEVEAMFNS